MIPLLNFSTHPGEPEIFDCDWNNAAEFLENWDFGGFELYPVGDYPFDTIPEKIIKGVHLGYFVILTPMWRRDRKRLVEIFGDMETVNMFYGGDDPDCIVQQYADQLDLAHMYHCPYVVFHPSHMELDYVYDWNVPWTIQETLDVCVEVLNEAVKRSAYDGHILFENLWWPGGFRLDSIDEYDYLLSRVNHPNLGLVLDTGHFLNKNTGISTEEEAVDYLSACVDKLGDIKKHVKTVHLTKSISGDYIEKTRGMKTPFEGADTFWEKFSRAREHVRNVDQHEAFTTPLISSFLEKTEPEFVVFEFTFSGKTEWENKIKVQKQALFDVLWPA